MKRIFALISVLLLSLFFAVSCSIPGIGGLFPEGEKTPENLIFDKTTELNIIIGETEIADDMLTEFYDLFLSEMTKFPVIKDDSAEETDHEIVIGRSSRSVSLEGYRLMERNEADSRDHSRYLIYSDGSSLAICFDEDDEDAALTVALDYFANNLMTLPLCVKEGAVTKGQINVTEFINTADEEFIEEKWAKLESEVGAEITASLKSLYSVFGDGVIDWFANLYDPGVGGYYFSNSGRDGKDFLPDIESTSQALGYVTASGMLMQTGETIKDFIPEDMQKEIIRFAKSLQDPVDGYFYHPQWGKAIASSRKTRDLSWATGVLSNFGSAPTYNAPNGVKGDGILADGTAAVMPLSAGSSAAESKVCAVSRVVLANAVEERFESAEKFLEYLEDRFGDEGNQPIWKYSYVAGNELSTLCNVIVARDKVLAEEDQPTIAPMLIDWLNERQNEFGHWHYETDEDGKPLTDSLGNYIPLTNYYANNGLLKIINVYNSLGYKMNKMDAAIETAVDAITSEEEVAAIVDIYNTWFCVNCIRRNLVNYGGSEGAAEYAALKERLYDLAPSAIIVTRDKLSIFLKLDGSFSQSPTSSSSTSQNAPVAVPGTNEGDVNATRIALQTITDLYGSLNITDYFVPLYTHGDAVRYKELLEKLTPFEKPTIDFIAPDVEDDKALGSGLYKDAAISYSETSVKALSEEGLIGTNYPQYLLFDDSNGDITASVQKVNGEEVLEFKNYHFQRDPMLLFNVKDKTLWDKNDSYVIETDFLYEFGTRSEGGEVFQIFLLTDKSSSSSIWYEGSISITHNISDDRYYLNGFGVKDYTIDLCKWYNLRLEITDTRSGTASLKLYLNGELIGEKTATTAARQIEALSIRHRFDVSNGRIFLDNTYVNSVNETGEEYVDPNIYIDIPEYVRGEGASKDVSETFTDKNASDAKDAGILGSFNTGLIESGFYGIYFDDDDPKGIQYAKGAEADGDGALEFGSKGNGDPYLSFLNTGNGVTGIQNDSYVLEFDYLISSLSSANGSGNYFVFYLSSTSDKYTETGVSLVINKNAYNEYYLGLSGSKNVVKIELSRWYNVRLEIKDTTEGAAVTLTVNGKEIDTVELNRSLTVGCMMTRFSWAEKNGQVFFDNLYFANFEE